MRPAAGEAQPPEDEYDDGCMCLQSECPECGLECTWCGGEGWDECTDPIQCCSSQCDGEYCPCRACDGTGLRTHQRIF